MGIGSCVTIDVTWETVEPAAEGAGTNAPVTVEVAADGPATFDARSDSCEAADLAAFEA